MTSPEAGLALKGAEEFDASEARRHFGSNVNGEHSVVPFNGKKVLEPVAEASQVTEQKIAEHKNEVGDGKDQVYNPTTRAYTGLAGKYHEEPAYKALMAREKQLNWTLDDSRRNQELGNINQNLLDFAKKAAKNTPKPSGIII